MKFQMNTPARWLTGAREAARLLAGRVGGSPALVSAVIYPTHRCNLRCTYCNSPFLKTPELTTEQWLTAIDELRDLGCRRVAFLGGEPLLRADLGLLIERVRNRGMNCVLTSNGTLVPKHIDRLRRLTTLVLSLDAPNEANDEVRGAGVYAGVELAVQAARAAGIPVKLNAVISAVTAPHLDALLTYAEAQDLSLTVNIMRSSGADLYRDAATIKAEDEEIQQVLEKLAVLARVNRRLLFSPRTYRYASRWGSYGLDRIETGEARADDPRVSKGPKCHAGRSYLIINPDGTVFPCPVTVNRIKGGNVATDGVAAAWRSLHDHPCVACFSPCMVEQNHLCSLTPSVMLHFAQRHWAVFT
jgi:MoaA/NifB/PqqE/SkfB family radical SAM enzyme